LPTATTAPAEPLAFNNPVKYSVTYSVTISSTGFTPSDIRLYLPAPSAWDAQRDVVISEVMPQPTSQAAEPDNDNLILYWQLTNSPARSAQVVLTQKFDLTAYETNTSIDPAQLNAYDTSTPEYQKYTSPEKYIESDDERIVALAEQIAGQEKNPYVLARLFYDHIIQTARYQKLGQGLNGALYLLTNGKGECGDYSSLFIALCRARGIPARPIVGYWAISGNDQTHVWAEFFLEGIGWIPVDPTIGQQSPEYEDYYFGNMDNQRIILSKGFNHKLVPSAPDDYVAAILQVPLWWYWGKGDADQLSMSRSWIVSTGS